MDDESRSQSYSYFNRNSNTTSDEDTEKEAIWLLKSQNQKIIELTHQLDSKSEMINIQKEQIATLTEKLTYFEDNFASCEKIKSQFNIFLQEKEALRIKLYTKDKLLSELQQEFNEINEKCITLNEQLTSRETANDKVAQLVELIKQYSRDLNEMTQKNKLYELELLKLNKELEKVMKINQKHDRHIATLESSSLDDINAANKDINLLVQWIDSYMGVYFDNSVEIPEVPSFYQSCPKINFELLRSKINSTRKKINEGQYQYESTIQKMNNEHYDLITQLEKQSKDLSFAKSEIIRLKGIIDDLNHEREKSEIRIQKVCEEYKKKEDLFSCFLLKMNKIIIKLKRDSHDYQDTKDEKEALIVFERNFSKLIEYVIEIDNQIELLLAFRKDFISKEELGTIKSYYQNQINNMEKEIKANFDLASSYKEENEQLHQSLEIIEGDKNKLLQDNFQLIKLQQANSYA